MPRSRGRNGTRTRSDTVDETARSGNRSGSSKQGKYYNNDNTPDTKCGGKKKTWGKKKWLTQQHLVFKGKASKIVGVGPHEDFGDSFDDEKPDGVIRLMGGNVDRFNPVNFNNPKGNLLWEVLKWYQVDGFWGQEASLNWDLMPRSGHLEEMFRSENAHRTITAHNKHE